MNIVTLEISNGEQGCMIKTSDSQVSVSLTGAEIDSILSDLQEESTDSMTFSFVKKCCDFGPMHVVICSPEIDTSNKIDNLKELSETFDLTKLDFIDGYIAIGSKLLTISKDNSFISISEDPSITSLEYYSKSNPSQKETAVLTEGFYKIPYTDGDTIGLESNIGKQYIKM